MNHSMSGRYFPSNVDIAQNDNSGDTALCLASNRTRSNSRINIDLLPADDSCRLFLGLGSTSSSYSGDYYSMMVNKGKESSFMFGQGCTSESDTGILKLGLSSGIHKNSVLAEDDLNRPYQSQISPDKSRTYMPIFDEGSTSSKRSGGYMPSLLLAPRHKDFLKTQELLELGKNNQHPHFSGEPSPGYSMGTISESAATRTSSDQRVNHPKKCKFGGCSTGARGASGLCIAHGGGQRCQKLGCNKGAESRTVYCKGHGGGKRCNYLGCTKSAEGKTDYCIAHGGGKRCGNPGCTKAARGKSGLCIKHGGGKRCKIEECKRSAEGQAGLCISHGGGPRCQFPECTKGAQGSTKYCKAHGGGKRCIFEGCTKGAEGSTPLCKGHGGGRRCLYDGGGICPKSVHGGTDFCVAHGGGKRCAVSGCTKSARGRTDCCVRHGGGKRCQFDNCKKSAQGSTDFCKAHGGGKRCTWSQGTCEKFARGKSGLCAAHSSMVHGKTPAKNSMIGPGLFNGLVSVSTRGSSSSSSISAVSDCIDMVEKPAKRQKQNLIPPLVLVPSSMKLSTSSSLFAERGGNGAGGNNRDSFHTFSIPEGRVHGGGLLSLLGGNLRSVLDGM